MRVVGETVRLEPGPDATGFRRVRAGAGVALEVADGTGRFLHHQRGRVTVGTRTTFLLS